LYPNADCARYTSAATHFLRHLRLEAHATLRRISAKYQPNLLAYQVPLLCFLALDRNIPATHRVRMLTELLQFTNIWMSKDQNILAMIWHNRISPMYMKQRLSMLMAGED
jgi:hypothetical protein